MSQSYFRLGIPKIITIIGEHFWQKFDLQFQLILKSTNNFHSYIQNTNSMLPIPTPGLVTSAPPAWPASSSCPPARARHLLRGYSVNPNGAGVGLGRANVRGIAWGGPHRRSLGPWNPGGGSEYRKAYVGGVTFLIYNILVQ